MIQTAWARVFAHSLRDAGLSELVVSPGSRSTPFLAAARHAGLPCRAIIDERAAAFFALGRAKVTGRPVALLCTSGTAAAHYYPAVIEASESFTPLLVVTADRPLELHGCGAPQTIDQTRLYGHHARAFFELGAPEAEEGSLRALRRKVAQAVYATEAPIPGPVHVNAMARKPLAPADPESFARSELAGRVARVIAGPLIRPPPLQRAAPPASLAEFARTCAASRRGLVVVGPLPTRQRSLGSAVFALGAATGFPVLAEAASQCRFAGRSRPEGTCDAFDLLLSSPAFRDQCRPDLIIQLGPPPTSSSLQELVASRRDACRLVFAEHGWPDPDSSAAGLIVADLADSLPRAVAEVERLGPAPRETTWRRWLRRAEEVAWRCVESELARSRPGACLGEGQAVRAAVAAAPDGCTLAVGNSLPIRTVDTYCPGTGKNLDVWCQRGGNGIDGLIAGAAGAASLGDRPVVLVLGDVSFAHDVGGLAAARHAAAPLVVVVIDNQGGRIFEHLALGAETALENDFDALWITPPGCDIRAAAALYGHGYAEPGSSAELGREVAAAARMPGCTIIRARVAPGSAREERQRLEAAIAAALAQDGLDRGPGENAVPP